jgi:hypothetical protein
MSMAGMLRLSIGGRRLSTIDCQRSWPIWFAQVTAIAATEANAALAAKEAGTTIPIIFRMSADPIALGLVASLSRPGAMSRA